VQAGRRGCGSPGATGGEHCPPHRSVTLMTNSRSMNHPAVRTSGGAKLTARLPEENFRQFARPHDCLPAGQRGLCAGLLGRRRPRSTGWRSVWSANGLPPACSPATCSGTQPVKSRRSFVPGLHGAATPQLSMAVGKEDNLNYKHFYSGQLRQKTGVDRGQQIQRRNQKIYLHRHELPAAL
jgi:hypothetical protein